VLLVSKSLLLALGTFLGPASQDGLSSEFLPLFRRHLRKADLAAFKSAKPAERHGVRILSLLSSGHLTNSLSQIR